MRDSVFTLTPPAPARKRTPSYRIHKPSTSQEIKLLVAEKFRNAMKTKYNRESKKGSTFKNQNLKNGCYQSIWWWEPPMECLPLDFCRDTSLHGLKYIGQSKRHLSERIFWFLSFLVGMCVAVYLISDVWRKYKDSPVIVTFEPSETSIDKIPFPAITICNMNKVLKSKADEYIRLAESGTSNGSDFDNYANIYHLNNVCKSSKSFTSRFNFSSSRGYINKTYVDYAQRLLDSNDTSIGAIQSFLKMSSQSCTEMIPLCTWHDVVVPNCTTLFHGIETEFGKCCTFNMVPDSLLLKSQGNNVLDQEENQKWLKWDAREGGLFPKEEPAERLEFPRRQIRAGKSFGLSILLDPDLDEYFCTNSDSIGFRITAHLPTETPNIIDFGLAVNPNSEVFFEIRPEITTADASIHGYELEKRQCYFPGEYILQHYNYYTAGNCFDECVSDVTFANCTCVRFYMPRNSSQQLCGPQNFTCVDIVKAKLADVGLKKSCDHCLPSCVEIVYKSQTTSTPIQDEFNIWELNEDGEKIPTAPKWAKNKTTILHVYFGTDSTYARVRKQLYGVTDLIANTGGLMGLCLGFSGLSAMEVLYFLSLRAWCRTRRKRTYGTRIARKFRDIWTKLKAIKTYGRESRESSTGRHFGGSGNLAQQNRVRPVNIKSQSFPAIDSSDLPDYCSAVNEINPYYTKRYWNQMEMKAEL